jgi:hypothetical protein
MKDNIKSMSKNNFLKINKKRDGGYILAFTLVIVSILLLVSLSVSRIIAKEMFFSKLIELSKTTYFAADSGIECAKYLDSNFKDLTLGTSLILNSTSSDDGNYDFTANSNQNIFFASSTVIANTGITSPSGIYCNSDDGTYNQVFGAYASTPQAVETNLSNRLSSFNVIGDGTDATTTFGLILKDTDPNTGEQNIRCALVIFSKQKSNVATDTAVSFEIISTGYSSCDPNNRSRVSRTIFESSS